MAIGRLVCLIAGSVVRYRVAQRNYLSTYSYTVSSKVTNSLLILITIIT